MIRHCDWDAMNKVAIENQAETETCVSDTHLCDNQESSVEEQQGSDFPDLDQLTGLIDPSKPNDPDFISETDLQIARNLRRLEIHRYEIASALENLSDEEIGQCTIEDEEEIELSKSDLDYVNQKARKLEQKNKQKRLDPDQWLQSKADQLKRSLNRTSNKITKGLHLDRFTSLRHDLCVTLHQKKYDKEIEARLFRPLTDSMAFNQQSQEAYGPCAPVKLVDWSLEQLAAYQEGASFRHFTFLDPQAGHGRTLLLAAQRDFRSIIGIEDNQELAETATLNIAQYPRTYMVQREVQLFSDQLLAEQWPDNPMLILIFQPRSQDWLQGFLEQLSASFYANPRQIYLVFIDNQHKQLIEEIPFMQPFTAPASNIETTSLLAPYEIDFYFSIIPHKT